MGCSEIKDLSVLSIPYVYVNYVRKMTDSRFAEESYEISVVRVCVILLGIVSLENFEVRDS